MAAKIKLGLLVLLFSSTFLHLVSSQSSNIQTFFPSNPSPAFVNPPPPPPPSSPSSSPTPSPSTTHTKRSDIVKAVIATAASCFALSGLLCFAFLRYSAKKESKRKPGENPFSKGRSRFERLRPRSNLNGVIVDENGLDAIYWRESQGENQRRCPNCHGSVTEPSSERRGDEGGDRDDRRWRRRRTSGSADSNSTVSEAGGGSPHSPISVVVVESAADSRLDGPSLPRRSASSTPQPETAEVAAVVAVSSVASQQQSPPLPPLPPPPGTSNQPPPPPPPHPALAATPPPPPSAAPPAPPPPPRTGAPPPPPPPKGPGAPPPPPPPMGAKGPPAPPPPRPPSGNKNVPPGMPPPPPPRGGGASTRPPPPQMGAGGDAAQKKMKPLHWDKMNPANANHSMVWDRITDGSFKVDEGIMEALFGTLATNRKTPQSGSNASSSAAAVEAQISLLDSRKSQNIAIVLRSLAVSRQDILDTLLDGHGSLAPDILEKLSHIAPTKDEEKIIREFSGNPARLADAENFLFQLLRDVPSPFARINALVFKSNYASDISIVKKNLQTLESACKELRTRGLFLKLLEAVLKAGNRMNAGTARGNAQAFNLTALRKLSDVKSSDGSTTLLHFIVEEVVRTEGKRCVVNRDYSMKGFGGGATSQPQAGGKEERENEYMKLGLPVVGGLSAEFANVKKAALIDYDALVGTCGVLGGRISEIKKLLDSCGDDGFAREMRAFVAAAEEELAAVREQQVQVLELVKRTTEYYHAGATKDRDSQALQLFIIVKDFLGMVDQACVDIAKNLQQKKPPPPPPREAVKRTGSDSSAEGSSTGKRMTRRITARFPNLPTNFMSEHSNSDSSSDEE
ncbi:formin-like protein 16 [Typha angustifolia]|uniref:formin-like protein 16 n=1 Tax=Typha angustifolia TaxID=59011 RepID=UPI003C2BB61D